MKDDLPKTFDFARLCRDRGIGVAPPGHRHCRRGWVATFCPFCDVRAGGDNYYLGYSETAGVFTCWRCGRAGKGKVVVVSSLLGVSTRDAAELIRKYAGVRAVRQKENPIVLPAPTSSLEIPGSTEPLACHTAYLHSRKFDPAYLSKAYGLRYCGMFGDYRYRIIIPIYGEFGGKWQVVSFQGRDATGVSGLRYKACPRTKELVHHKHILYGEKKDYKGKIILVEGVFDAWRMGEVARATFGIGYTQEQVVALSRYDEVLVLFDCEEDEAQKQADRIAWDVRKYGGRALAITVRTGGRDPAELTDEEAAEIRQQLGFK